MIDMLNTMSAAKTGTKELPAIKPTVDVDTLTAIDASTLEDSFVYVHCYFHNAYKDMLIRVWRTTYLIDRSSGSRSKLVHVENISLAPVWTQVPDGSKYSFLLIFNALPKSCQLFDLFEDIPQPGGFFVEAIARNKTDVYHIDLH